MKMETGFVRLATVFLLAQTGADNQDHVLPSAVFVEDLSEKETELLAKHFHAFVTYGGRRFA
jgi:hypothetical protein